MNNKLAPTHHYLFGDSVLLWYALSNSYSIVDCAFKQLLDSYFKSNTLDTFLKHIDFEATKTTHQQLITTITDYLKHCNITTLPITDTPKTFNAANRNILKHYTYNGKTFQVYFDSEHIQKLIHPALAYLETTFTKKACITFDIFIEGETITLFKNEKFINSYPKQEYHKLQGKFIIHLLGYIHDLEETDWIGSFHGSTITDGNSSLLFIGKSGKGKSTLCAILAANGYKLVADDVSPLSSETIEIHSNPAAISIKSGAFTTLKPMFTNFDTLPSIQLSKIKGPIKYVAPTPLEKSHYPCRQIILVNYQKNAETKLKVISITKVLETLIPDSWLSPNPKHAKQFLDWLQTLAFYELSYSDTTSVLKEVKKIFLKNNKAKI